MTPRIFIVSPGAQSGKTLVAAGLIQLLKKADKNVAAFKSGIDYSDQSFLNLVQPSALANLDLFCLKKHGVEKVYNDLSLNADISIIDGEKGFLDAYGGSSRHNDVQLATLLKTPLLAIIDTSQMLETAALFVKGLLSVIDNEMPVSIILNKVNHHTQATAVKNAIKNICDLPVIGEIPRIKGVSLFQKYTPSIYNRTMHDKTALEIFSKIIEDNVDLPSILSLADQAVDLKYQTKQSHEYAHKNVVIGYVYDDAFCYLYDENLKALEANGAELVRVNTLSDNKLPEIDALYICGGYPELYLKELVSNKIFIKDLQEKAENGMPVYAECGGFMYLCKSISSKNEQFDMAGIFPMNIIVGKAPAGLNYAELRAEEANPFFVNGTLLRGHEMHYSFVEKAEMYLLGETSLTMRVLKGSDSIGGKEGWTYKNVFGTYLHLNANACPEWARGMINIAHEYRQIKN